MTWLIIRKPCLMEDEGRHDVQFSVDTEDEAKTWIAKQNGYFKSSDYYYIKVKSLCEDCND